ncbi:cyclin-D4-1-like [Ananas comosus]|uniref:Cyclin-D4-1-like n=1 Tax=Ananas comosus TaxID=4615 RepID=A0A6P5ENR2_ANACO|nr:cyclin-D4-1-like [Ananas comosus]
MAPSYDCTASILLCVEDNESVMGFDEEEEISSREVEGHARSGFLGQRSGFYGDFLMDFPLQTGECLALLVERECEHLPRGDYAERLKNGALDLSIRRDAIDWMWKVHAYYGFGPLSAYLAVNYLDRFLSAYELPQGNAWMTQLLSVACLSLAAKMEETEVPLSLDLQVGEAKFVFEARTIQRMELLVLSTLKWRMQAVTPFSFIDYFLHKLNDGTAPSKLSVSRAVELVLSITRGVDFLAFRPSQIAAAVALTVLGETHIVEVERAINFCTHVEKERVLRCCELIQDMMLRRDMSHKTAGSSISSVPRSPIGVLDAACLSYRSEDATVGSHATCHESSPANKRRRISRLPFS